MKILIAFIISFSAFAQVPLHWIGKQPSQKSIESNGNEQLLESRINSIVQAHEKAIEKSNENIDHKKYRLDRFDAQVGIAASGDIGVLGVAGGSAMEFIWRRKQSSDFSGDEIKTISVHTLSSENEIYSDLEKHIDQAIDLKKVNKKKRRLIVDTLRKDAQKISKLIESFATMPRVGLWYLSGFFKNYYFSASGDIGVASLGYAKRVRFRFRFSSIPLVAANKEDLNITQKVLYKMMKGMNRLSSWERQDPKFRLERIWSIHALGTELDLAVVKVSKSKAIQIAFRRVPDGFHVNEFYNSDFDDVLNDASIDEDTFVYDKLSDISRSLVEKVSNVESNDDVSYPLSQIRFKFSKEVSGGFSIVSLEKSSTLQLHFNRRRNVQKEVRLEVSDTPSKPNLYQVDHRHRFVGSVKFPGILRLRVRPSIEYRYGVKKD